jgi:hypothetical protein
LGCLNHMPLEWRCPIKSGQCDSSPSFFEEYTNSVDAKGEFKRSQTAQTAL